MGSEVRSELASSLTKLLADRFDREQLTRWVDDAPGQYDAAQYDAALYAELSAMGLVGLAIDERRGGQSGQIADLVVALEVVGRSLAPVPLHSTSAALAVLDRCGDADDVVRTLLGQGGSATLALSEGGAWEAAPTCAARAEGGQTVLTGSKDFVLDADAADCFVVSAVMDGSWVLAAVDGTAAGIEIRAHSPLDLTRGIARVDFSATPASILARGEAAEAALESGLDVARILLAAEQVGGAQACLDQATEYAKVREQFGQPIGAFQAIKHKLADMYVRLGGARSLVTAAADAADGDDRDELAVLAAAVSHYASDAFVFCAQQNIQVHGGIGYTWEHVAHLYLRRARSTEVVYGSPADHRERLASLSVPDLR